MLFLIQVKKKNDVTIKFKNIKLFVSTAILVIYSLSSLLRSSNALSSSQIFSF